MKRISAFELLAIRDSTLHLSVLEKSLYLLGVVYETDSAAMADLSIGDRDTRLLKFREWIFGSRLINMAHCPTCNNVVEWEANVDDILLKDLETNKDRKTYIHESEGYTINFRLPNSYDIINATKIQNQSDDASAFISACILNIVNSNVENPQSDLPQKIFQEISRQMSEADPQAEISMVLNCPDCNNQWNAPFNILNYLWLEIDNWAKHILKEVVVLARHFGWSEKEILNLSFQRRQYYMEMIN